MLTARDTVQDKIQGLNAGADDYLVKPFDLDELIARCAALIRRAQGQPSTEIAWRDIVFLPAARSVFKSGVAVALSSRELAILEVLMTNIGKTISKSEIESRIYDWGAAENVESNTVEVHVSSLRRKLGKNLIVTRRGIGYMVPE